VPRLRIGVAGLGRGFTLMLPTLKRHPRVQLVAAADPRAEARARFAADFTARTYESIEALCADPVVDAIYVATPHPHHAAHAIAATRAGKHVLVEKPMALTLAEASAMIDAAEAAGTQLVVGPSHSFDAPVARARAIIESGELGRVRMISALNFTDFLYRPRRREELDTRAGGGVVFSQAAHQVDIVRLLGGGLVDAVRAHTGDWDRERPTEGAYAALLTFAGGAFATLTYSGYGHFDSDEFMGGVSELGGSKGAASHGAARRALAVAADPIAEEAAKAARNYGGAAYREPPDALAHEHFGLVVIACERGDLRPMPGGVHVYGDLEHRFESLAPPEIPRAAVLDELCDAALDGRPPLHDGRWGRATLEACLALLESARTGADVRLRHQVPVG
jgi:phthalate 4,5-cis-dihydrodiol dehydrogenase